MPRWTTIYLVPLDLGDAVLRVAYVIEVTRSRGFGNRALL